MFTDEKRKRKYKNNMQKISCQINYAKVNYLVQKTYTN